MEYSHNADKTFFFTIIDPDLEFAQGPPMIQRRL